MNSPHAPTQNYYLILWLYLIQDTGWLHHSNVNHSLFVLQKMNFIDNIKTCNFSKHVDSESLSDTAVCVTNRIFQFVNCQ